MVAVEQVVGIEDGEVTAPEGSLVAMMGTQAVILRRQIDHRVLLGSVRSTLDEHTVLLKEHSAQLAGLHSQQEKLQAGQEHLQAGQEQLQANVGELQAEVRGLRSDSQRIIQMITDLATGEFPKK